jgi:hypothetical protein
VDIELRQFDLEVELVQALLSSQSYVNSGIYDPTYDGDESEFLTEGDEVSGAKPEGTPRSKSVMDVIECAQRGMEDRDDIARECDVSRDAVNKVFQRYPSKCKFIPRSKRRADNNEDA